jgi:hypothetical protein
MIRIPLVLVAAVSLLIPRAVYAAVWSLGSHIEMASVQSDVRGSGRSTVVAWPSNAFAYQPGLRIGWGNARRGHELLLDSGLFMLDEAGSTLSLLATSLSYQHAFGARSTTSPIANLGMGLFREGGSARASSSTSFGAGVGVRHVIHDGHGALRGEFRVDYLKRDAVFSRPTLVTLGLRLGFDLWL